VASAIERRVGVRELRHWRRQWELDGSTYDEANSAEMRARFGNGCAILKTAGGRGFAAGDVRLWSASELIVRLDEWIITDRRRPWLRFAARRATRGHRRLLQIGRGYCPLLQPLSLYG